MNPIDSLSVDLVRLTFVLGILLSVTLYEKSHITTGSIVVPGFLGLQIFQPQIIFLTFANALLCFLVVHVLIPRFCLMQNRHKFFLVVLLSVVIQSVLVSVDQFWLRSGWENMPFAGVGYVVPGLIAHDMARHKVSRTITNVMLATYVVGGFALAMVCFLPKHGLSSTVEPLQPFRFGLPLLLVLSAMGSIVLKLKTPLTSGGYVTAAYLVLLHFSAVTFCLVVLASVICFFVCNGMLRPNLILFGRRKFAAMILTGAVTIWGLDLVLQQLSVDVYLMNQPAYAGIVLLLPGLIANDVERTSSAQVIVGLGLLTTWIFVVASLYYEMQYFARPGQFFNLFGWLVSIVVIGLVAASLKKLNLGYAPSLPNTT